MPLHEFKNRFLYRGSVKKYQTNRCGKTVRRSFGSRFEFISDPMLKDGNNYYQRVWTGWKSGETDATFPFRAESERNSRAGSFWRTRLECVNRPYKRCRQPILASLFSRRKWARPIADKSCYAVTGKEIKDVQKFGRGELTIENLSLRREKAGLSEIRVMDFSVQTRRRILNRFDIWENMTFYNGCVLSATYMSKFSIQFHL